MKRADRANAPHYLYRCFDGDGQLIYVGSTVNLFGRLRVHKSSSWWSPQVAKVKATAHANGIEARRLEREIIQNEHPRWNVQGRWTTVRNSGDLTTLADYRRAFVEIGHQDTLWGHKHLATIDAEIARLDDGAA